MHADDLDRRILRHAQQDPQQSVGDLAESAGLSPALVRRRLARLEDTGILRGRRAVINWQALGYEVQVSLRLTLDKTNPRAFDELIEAARKVRQVIEIQTFLGRVDVRLSVIARDMADYQQIYRSEILNLPHITDIEALMLVARVHTRSGLPL